MSSHGSPSSAQPEYLADAPPRATSGSPGRRTAALALAGAAVVGVVGVGGWAAMSLIPGGAQPAEVVPANAIGYLSLDLDPSAAQKVEAIKMLRKFPTLAEDLEISEQDDLRRVLFEKVQEDGPCADLDYDQDIAPWIGDRIALAGVPAATKGEEPTPLAVLQVTDGEAAADGIAALARCAGAGKGFGFALAGEYVLLSDSTARAEALVAAAEQAPLAADPTFLRWTQAAGEPGIVTMYAAPGAVDVLTDLQRSLLTETEAGALLGPAAELDGMLEQLEEAYGDFGGMAGVVRFADGAVEAELAGDATSDELWSGTADPASITALPSGTAAAFGVALPEGWAEEYFDTMTGDDQTVEQMLRQAEIMTGLELPQDIGRLLGEGVTVAVDASLDPAAAGRNPSAVPAGVRIVGDPQEIRGVLDRIKTALGPHAQMLVVEQGEGAVAVGLHPAYVRELADGGALGDEVTFTDVVPDADRASGLVYVDFDAVEAWAAAADDGSAEAARLHENLAPLRALGVTSWVEEDGSEHGLLRLTTD